jgi:uncharacterized damage-inducible protein DinB
MNTDALISFFKRDLNRLITEIELYQNEENLWRIEKNIANSAGNLTLHLIGNLNTFIGNELGKTNYVRNRELEFSQKNVPRQALIDSINDTLNVVKDAIAILTDDALQEEYPGSKFLEINTTEYMLVHLVTHLTYHLGQINYHRRLIEG